MKFNWGTGIFIFFGVFVIFMLSMVYLSSQQKNELVTEDYYKKELAFKEVLKKQERTEQLSEKLRWRITNEHLEIIFPKEVGSKIKGDLIFFKPSNQKDDKIFSFQITKNTYRINISEFSSGMYKLKIDWVANNISYFNQEIIDLP